MLTRPLSKSEHKIVRTYWDRYREQNEKVASLQYRGLETTVEQYDKLRDLWHDYLAVLNRHGIMRTKDGFRVIVERTPDMQPVKLLAKAVTVILTFFTL